MVDISYNIFELEYCKGDSIFLEDDDPYCVYLVKDGVFDVKNTKIHI